jgi:hypothetical protein
LLTTATIKLAKLYISVNIVVYFLLATTARSF